MSCQFPLHTALRISHRESHPRAGSIGSEPAIWAAIQSLFDGGDPWKCFTAKYFFFWKFFSLPNPFFSTLQVWPNDVHDSRVSSRNSNSRSPNLDFNHDHDHGHIQDNLNNWELSEIANLKGGAQRVEEDKNQIGRPKVPRNLNLSLLFWLLPLGVPSGGSTGCWCWKGKWACGEEGKRGKWSVSPTLQTIPTQMHFFLRCISCFRVTNLVRASALLCL